ncbi:MAG: hypothetical protein Q8O67_09675 [Deltaproteobacteria bacterium]|nr:hypothetical protein [Deltaproteobacteria bacterium]
MKTTIACLLLFVIGASAPVCADAGAEPPPAVLTEVLTEVLPEAPPEAAPPETPTPPEPAATPSAAAVATGPMYPAPSIWGIPAAALGGAVGAGVGVGLVAGLTAGSLALFPSASGLAVLLAVAAVVAVPLVPALGALLAGVLFVGARGELTAADAEAAFAVSTYTYVCACTPCLCVGSSNPLGFLELPLRIIGTVQAGLGAVTKHSGSRAFAPAVGAALGGGAGVVVFGAGVLRSGPRPSDADLRSMAALGAGVAVGGAALGAMVGGLAAQ